MPDADALVDALRSVLVEVAASGGTITYDALVDRVAGAAEVELAPLLRTVSIDSDEAGRGLLTALVVRRSDGLPGTGFFRLAAHRGRDADDRRACWEREVSTVWRAYASGST